MKLFPDMINENPVKFTYNSSKEIQRLCRSLVFFLQHIVKIEMKQSQPVCRLAGMLRINCNPRMMGKLFFS